MNQEVKKFYDAMTIDEALRLRAGEINQKFADKKPDEADVSEAIVAFAADQGFSFTKEELNAYGESMKNEAMKAVSDVELTAVVGGAGGETQSDGCVRCFISGQCFCVVGGGGQHHEPDWTCVCIVGGLGGKCSRGRMLSCPIAGAIGPFSIPDSD